METAASCRIRRLVEALSPSSSGGNPFPTSPAPTFARGGSSGSPFPSCAAEPLAIRPSDDTELMLRQLREQGLCVMRGVIPADRIPAVRDAAVQTSQRHDYLAPSDHWSAKAPFAVGDLSLAPHVPHPGLLSLLRAALGCEELAVITTSTQVNRPLCGQHAWHTDWSGDPTDPQPAGAYWPGPNERRLRPRVINTLWMLTPFTPGNGGTYVLPCSHRREPGEPEGGFHGLGFPTSSLGDGQIPPHPDTVHVTGEAGCVCCFDGRLWHAAAPNRTEDQPRVMVNLRFAAAHLLEPAGNYDSSLVERAATSLSPRDSMSRTAWERLPAAVRPLYAASVREDG